MATCLRCRTLREKTGEVDGPHACACSKGAVLDQHEGGICLLNVAMCVL